MAVAALGPAGGVSLGKLSCFGFDGYGVDQAPAGNHKSVSLGEGHACAVRTNDRVRCWGDNLDDETDVPPGLK